MTPTSTAAIAACFIAGVSASAVPAAAPSFGASPAPSSGSAAAGTHVAKKAVLPFIEDDYSAALAAATRRGLPIFVEAWAPW